MDETASAPARNRQREFRLWLWLIVAAICLGAGGWRAWQNHERSKRESQWLIATALRERKAAIWQAKVGRWLFDGVRSGMSRAEVTDALRLGTPRSVTSEGSREVARWVDAGSGESLQVEFRDGRAVGWGFIPGPMVPPPPAVALDVVTNGAWKAVRRYLPFAWMALLMLCLVWRGRRLVLAELTTAVAAVCFVAWLVKPNYSLTWKGMSSNDSLFFGTVMVVMSLAAWGFFYLRRPRSPGYPACPQCEYNLTGNVSGICPECGWAISAELRDRVASTALRGT